MAHAGAADRLPEVVYTIDLRSDLDAALALIAKLRTEKEDYFQKYEHMRHHMLEAQEVISALRVELESERAKRRELQGPPPRKRRHTHTQTTPGADGKLIMLDGCRPFTRRNMADWRQRTSPNSPTGRRSANRFVCVWVCGCMGEGASWHISCRGHRVILRAGVWGASGRGLGNLLFVLLQLLSLPEADELKRAALQALADTYDQRLHALREESQELRRGYFELRGR
jgi:hypothetical protein